MVAVCLFISANYNIANIASIVIFDVVPCSFFFNAYLFAFIFNTANINIFNIFRAFLVFLNFVAHFHQQLTYGIFPTNVSTCLVDSSCPIICFPLIGMCTNLRLPVFRSKLLNRYMIHFSIAIQIFCFWCFLFPTLILLHFLSFSLFWSSPSCHSVSLYFLVPDFPPADLMNRPLEKFLSNCCCQSFACPNPRSFRIFDNFYQ